MISVFKQSKKAEMLAYFMMGYHKYGRAGEQDCGKKKKKSWCKLGFGLK